MKADPQPEHAWLDKLVGEWRVSMPSPPQDGKAPGEMQWTESVRSMNGIWIVADGQGTMPDGTPARTLMTLGPAP